MPLIAAAVNRQCDNEQQANGQLLQTPASTTQQPSISSFRSQLDVQRQVLQQQPAAAEQGQGQLVITQAAEALLSLSEAARLNADNAAAAWQDGQTVSALLQVCLMGM